MGTPDFAVPTLEALLASEFAVVGVVTQPDRPKGRGKKMSPSPVKALAQAHGLPLLQPIKMKQPEFLDALRQWQPECIVVAAFGRILPKVILDLPQHRCINVHASLLPKYRGAAPIQWALINGETETGITTMLMDEGMDTGAMLLQERVPILPEETAGDLSGRLARVGGPLLIETLRGWVTNRVIPVEQCDSEATMAPLIKKDDGCIDWDQGAEEIVNRIRGLSPWPGAYTFCRQTRITIWKAVAQSDQDTLIAPDSSPGAIVRVEKDLLIVKTGQGLLAISELQSASRNRMEVGPFVSGYHLEPGIRFTGPE